MPSYSDYKKAKGKLSGVSAREAAAAGWDKKYAKDTGQESTPSKEKPKEERETIDLRTEKKETRGFLEGSAGQIAKDIIVGRPKEEFEEIVGGKVVALTYTGPIIGGTSLIGKRIPDKTVEAAGRAAGLTKKGIGQLKWALGQTRVQQVANTLTNPKSTSLIKTVMSKLFSKEAMILFGSLAGTVGLGKWAQKESAEPITFVMKDVLRQAQITGDWTLYNEAAAARDDLTDMNKWEQYLSWTPIISPFITIPKAIKGVIQGGKIMDEVAKQAQIQQETGETEDEKWARIDAERETQRETERAEDEAYYKQVQKDIADAKSQARKDDERYWANVLKEREAYETAKKEAESKYWEDVRKMNEELRKEERKQYEDYGKSQLSFGLL